LSDVKTVKATYHIIEAADNNYFDSINNNFNTLLQSGEASGSFDVSNDHFLWKINEKIKIDETNLFYISLVKEKKQLPVWFNDDGVIKEIPKDEGMIGELFYALFSPLNRFIITTSATTGAAASSYKRLLNEFSSDLSIRFTPLFEDDVDKKVLSWNYYKRLSASINFPTDDDLTEFMATKHGAALSMIDSLGGLKIDINISNPKPKQMLDPYQVKEFISAMVEYDLCEKLLLRGGEFDSEVTEDIDIKNAVIKYIEKVIIDDSYLSHDDAKDILVRAFADKFARLVI